LPKKNREIIPMRVVLSASAAAVILLASGCGGGKDAMPAETSGVLHSQIKGVSYRTPSRSGQTDTHGTFNCLVGETVTFSVGGIELGSATASSKISLFTLAGLTPPTSELALRRELWRMQSTTTPLSRATNLAMLLLALDADGNPDNGIDVSPHAGALANTQLDFRVRFHEFPAKLARLAPDLNRNMPASTPVKWLYRSLGIAVAGNIPKRQRDDYDGDGIIDSDLTSTEDAQGEYETLSVDLSADGQPDQITTFTLDSLGRITRRRMLEDPFQTGTFQIEHIIDTTFDSFGNELRRVNRGDGGVDGSVDSEAIFESTVDRFGRILNSTSTIDSDFDGVLDSIERHVYTRDARGNALELRIEVDLDADGSIDGRYVTINTYDAGDRLLTSLYERDLDGNGEPESRIAQASTYDAAGRAATFTEEYDFDGDGEFEQSRHVSSSYDAAGNLARTVSRDDSSFFGDVFTYEVTTEFTYDRDRRFMSSNQHYDFESDGTIESRITEAYTRDPNGFPLTWESLNDIGADGTVDQSTVVSFAYTPEGAQQSFVADSDYDGDGIVDATQISQVSYAPAANALTPIVNQYLGF
jgi:hypothetical protein